jgi:hypothetical protein
MWRIERFCESVACEVAPLGIGVTTVEPCARTEFRYKSDQRERRAPPPRSCPWPGCCTRASTSCASRGSVRLERIEENLGAAEVEFTDAECASLEAELASIEIMALHPTRASPSAGRRGSRPAAWG